MFECQQQIKGIRCRCHQMWQSQTPLIFHSRCVTPENDVLGLTLIFTPATVVVCAKKTTSPTELQRSGTVTTLVSTSPHGGRLRQQNKNHKYEALSLL